MTKKVQVYLLFFAGDADFDTVGTVTFCDIVLTRCTAGVSGTLATNGGCTPSIPSIL